MNILTRKREFLQQLAPHIPLKISRLFSFGFETLVALEIRSTRSNARKSKFSWTTAKATMWRMLANKRLVSVFPLLLKQLDLVSSADTIAIDFSDFGDARQVLMFAKQTEKGRALPLYFEILEYPIRRDSQNLFVIDTIEHFVSVVGCRPLLVFDRGFACPAIIKHLYRKNHPFIIRIKKRKSVERAGRKTAAEEARTHDSLVKAYGLALRLVVSDVPNNGNDPWYLITNDTNASRTEIIDWYYHRFEIEEFFRDAKRLLRLEWVWLKTKQSLTILLWFAILTCWLFVAIAEKLTEAEEYERERWRVSRFRYVLEKLEHELLWSAQELAESGVKKV